MLIPLPNYKIFDMTRLKAFADNKLNVAKITISLFDGLENTGKRRKHWLPAFSYFPTEFSKAPFLRVVRSWDCVVKDQGANLDKNAHLR